MRASRTRLETTRPMSFLHPIPSFLRLRCEHCVFLGVHTCPAGDIGRDAGANLRPRLPPGLSVKWVLTSRIESFLAEAFSISYYDKTLLREVTLRVVWAGNLIIISKQLADIQRAASYPDSRTESLRLLLSWDMRNKPLT